MTIEKIFLKPAEYSKSFLLKSPLNKKKKNEKYYQLENHKFLKRKHLLKVHKVKNWYKLYCLKKIKQLENKEKKSEAFMLIFYQKILFMFFFSGLKLGSEICSGLETFVGNKSKCKKEGEHIGRVVGKIVSKSLRKKTNRKGGCNMK